MPTSLARATTVGGRIGPAGASPDQVVGRADSIGKRLRPPDVGGRKCEIRVTTKIPRCRRARDLRFHSYEEKTYYWPAFASWLSTDENVLVS
jgi:hypothetical protein